MSQVFDKVLMYQAGFVTESLNEHRSNNKKCWGSSRIYFLSLSLYQYIYLWELLVTCAQCWGGALPAAICCCGVSCSGGILGLNRSVGCQCVWDRRGAPWTHGQSGQTPISSSSTPILRLQERCERSVQLPPVRIPCQFSQCPWVSLWIGNFCFWQPQGLYCCKWLKLNCYTEGILFIGCFILSFLMKWKSALPLLITIKSGCVSQSTWILYPGFFILAGCSVMAWAICEAGSDKVQCLVVHSGKQVHFSFNPKWMHK